jgi:hypothetical protein
MLGRPGRIGKRAAFQVDRILPIGKTPKDKD